MTDIELYNQQILDLAASVSLIGRLDAPHVSTTARSRLCGSQIIVDLRLDGDVISEYAHVVRACVVGKAVASVVARVVVGMPISEIRAGEAALRNLLDHKALPDGGPWMALEPLMPVADVRNRHTSAQLPFEALRYAFEKRGISG